MPKPSRQHRRPTLLQAWKRVKVNARMNPGGGKRRPMIETVATAAGRMLSLGLTTPAPQTDHLRAAIEAVSPQLDEALARIKEAAAGRRLNFDNFNAEKWKTDPPIDQAALQRDARAILNDHPTASNSRIAMQLAPKYKRSKRYLQNLLIDLLPRKI